MFKKIIKKNKLVYTIVKYFYIKMSFIKDCVIQSFKLIWFKVKFIRWVSRNNYIVIKIDFGGLGDALKYSTLPELFKTQYNLDFYLEESCKNLFRHESIFELCFKNNPYFKGFKKSTVIFNPSTFDCIYGKNNAVFLYEKLFCLNGYGLPKIYYKPKKLTNFADKIIIDKNQVTGELFGYKYDDNDIEYIILQNGLSGYERHYIDKTKQTLFEYVDMIYSCKYFISYMSGGGVLVAAIDKPSTVLLPNNIEVSSRAVFLWIFGRCKFVNYFHKGKFIK